MGTTDVHGHTLQTLQDIRKEQPDSEVYFIFGGDKLGGLSRWRSYEALVSQFRIIVFARDDIDPKEEIEKDENLARYANRFAILTVPAGLDGISSSAVHERLKNGLSAEDMLTPAVYTLLLAHRKQMEDTILCFQGKNLFLSNFYEGVEFWWRGFPYRSAEAAFQSAKCTDEAERNRFSYLSPLDAKRKGRSIPLPARWEENKDSIMEEVLRAKFFQNRTLAEKLMNTGNADLVEGNTWGDSYWGIDLHMMTGQNRLGKLLMKLRMELNNIPKNRFAFEVKPQWVDASFNDYCLGDEDSYYEGKC